jgi:hypothetical protein
MIERRTIAGWCHYLQAPDAELTLSEFMARCLLDLRENGLQARQAAEHVEGMLGTLDELMATTNGAYGKLAERRARPSAPSLNGGRS